MHVLIACSCFNASMWTVQLSGSIPPEIANLTTLIVVSIGGNQVREIGGSRDGYRRGAMSTRPVVDTKYEAFPK